jgi:catechol 2,3-dioxygenase-like lactoylglutathione lyase family enzyme
MPCNFTIGRVGNGVTDLGIAVPFYEALGFTVTPPFDLGTAVAEQTEAPDVPVAIQIARKDWLSLELCQQGTPRPPGPPERRPMNLLGLTHLAFAVDNVDRVVDIVRGHGGRDYAFARSKSSDHELGVDAAFYVDPFGTRLLLLGPGACTLAELPEPGADGITVAHLGICAADLGRTATFWDAIGFTLGETRDDDTTFSRLAELDGAPLRVRTATMQGYELLFLEWGGPRDAGVPVRLPLNRIGQLVHFGTHCDDFDSMLHLVAAHGGTVVERTRAVFPPPGLSVAAMDDVHGWIFVLDPNGVQIEIVGPQR